jgi:hypothetical protein
LVSAVHADEKTATLDDEYTRQTAGQVALAVEAEQCQLRSAVWRNKLIDAEGQRLAQHFKKVRPTWTDTENMAIAQQVLYGAIYGAKGDIGAPPVPSDDLTTSGLQAMAGAMACQVVQYRKADLLFLDRIIEAPGS